MTAEVATLTRTRMPTFFIPHGGGPCFFMDWAAMMGGPADTWDRMEAWLRALLSTVAERPKAIVLVSGHWEERAFTAASVPQPGMIYDYSGFPAHTYELKYPAPGNPALAQRIVELLSAAGLPAGIDTTRGYDHGVFIPMLLVDPEASIPVVTLSLQANLDPAQHLAAGHALAPLRDEGVLIVGSGMSYHNMRAFRSPAATAPSASFDAWLTQAVEAPEAEREALLAQWAQAPAGRNAHPREEHLLPLMVAAGAGGEDAGSRIFTDKVMMADVSGFRFG
jgi:aromatic ring-opening dioxygenase catalytic subunit (LigB family)